MFDFKRYPEEPPADGAQFLTPDMFRIARWILYVFVIVMLYLGLSFLRRTYTDFLWFDQLGYKNVFMTIFTTKLWLFFAGALIFAGFYSLNVFIVYRYTRGPILAALPEGGTELLKLMILWGVIIGGILASLVFGYVASKKWELLLRFMNSVPFNVTDPQFNKDVSFYVFALPVYRFIQGWLLGALIVTALAVLGLYAANFGLRAQPMFATIPVRVHSSILGAMVMFAVAAGHWMSRWELLYSPRGAVFGASFADVHANLPALVLMTAIAVASGVLMLVNAYLQGTRLIVGAFALWAATAIVAGILYPSLVQRFSVEPNEFSKEQEYIRRNIAFTRTGFNLDKIEEVTFPARQSLSAETVEQNQTTIQNIRIWDYRPLKDTYNQIQAIRLQYDFQDVDVDRYNIDGSYKQVMLSARELSEEKLPEDAKTWVNQKLQFTHGFGIAMSPVTQFTPEGRPVLLVKDIPPTTDTFQIDNPRIYFGENTRGFVIVNSRTQEFDYPTEGDKGVYATYQGTGGLALSSTLKRLAFAWELGDVNLLISGEVTPESRLMYRRAIQDRIKTLAPFLLLDQDPYVVVADNRLFWLQDAYTTTNSYPYSDPFEDSFNYIRNSVKIVVDAYNGDVRFYVWDVSDPLIQVYENMFPTMFMPMAQMPDSLRQHVRYPEDLFQSQISKYVSYHMKDPQVFYNQEDLWDIPTEQFYSASQPVEPYYVIMKIPGEQQEEFVLMMPFSPANKPNLIAWLAARSDGANYGRLKAFILPKERQIDGPSQVEARISNDPVISQQFTLWGQVGSVVIRGNLLVIPIGESILYVEPVFLQAQNLTYPELKRVIAVTGEKVAMESSLEQALAVVTGAASSTPVTGPGTTPPPSTGEMTPEKLRQQIEDLLKKLDALKGDLSDLQDALNKLEGLSQNK